MAKIDKKYHNLLKTILKEGFIYTDPNREGVKRLQIPSYTLKHDFNEGFPILTTKKTFFKGAVGELLVFLSGSTDLKDLHNKGIYFWDKDAYNFYRKEVKKPLSFEDWLEKVDNSLINYYRDLGKIYPYQMRKWDKFEYNWDEYGSYNKVHIDQISELVHTLQTNPMATKKTVTMWNPAQLEESCLSPCHWSFEALVEPLKYEDRFKIYSDLSFNPEMFSEELLDSKGVPKYSLTIKWHQHSVDTFLGLPINIMYYSLMCYILAEISGMVPKGVIGDLSNVHIYESHLDSVKQQLGNDVSRFANCNLIFNLNFFIDAKKYSNNFDMFIKRLEATDFMLDNYESYPAIKAKMLAYDL